MYPEDMPLEEIFVSHAWTEDFGEFVQGWRPNLPPYYWVGKYKACNDAIWYLRSLYLGAWTLWILESTDVGNAGFVERTVTILTILMLNFSEFQIVLS